MVAHIQIGSRMIGAGRPCFVIAEAGVNHNGRLDLAMQLVDAAVEAHADAVKFQTFKAIKLVTATAPKAEYQSRNTRDNGPQLDMLRKLELSEEHHRQLIEHCNQRGILFLSTPFDHDSADLLATLDLPAFKISSGDLTNLPLLEHISRKRKPIILSTGMSTLGEVEDAVQTMQSSGADFALLQCVSNYPAEPEESNLRAMGTLQMAFNVPVGYSDHTLGSEVCFAAVAMGACIVEKHFTLDRNLPGPDHVASAEPQELRDLVHGIRRIELALGSGRKTPAASELKTAAVARKSLVAARDIPAGAVLTEDLIAIKRPGTGLPPSMREHLLQRQTRCDIPAGSLILLENVA
jgi:N,N'-diacetyllegionaminate synthase